MNYKFQIGDLVQVGLPAQKYDPNNPNAIEWAVGKVTGHRVYMHADRSLSPQYVVHGLKARPFISHVVRMIRAA